MKNKLRAFLIRILGQACFNSLYNWINRIIGQEKDFIRVNEEYVAKVEEYKVDNKETFFGYYDINPFSPDKKKLLTLVIVDASAEIGYFELDSKRYHKITTTNCWNWQMGCRLRWINNQNIMFNDFDGENLISRVCSLQGTEVERYSAAFFDVDSESNCAYFLDFSTLHHFRPGYGYTNIPFEKKTLEEQGIFFYDMKKNNSKLILSIADINKKYPTKFDESFEQYINHIYVNPYNGLIMFFQIWVKEHEKENRHSRIIICDNEGNIYRILEDFEQVSHYWWKSEKEIMLTVISNKRNVEYRLYNILSGDYKIIQGSVLTEDGHPSYIERDLFITDTYPNKYGMQKLYICAESGMYKELLAIYHNPKRWGEHRCDLHPQYNSQMIHIDNNMSKKRSQMVLFLKDC